MIRFCWAISAGRIRSLTLKYEIRRQRAEHEASTSKIGEDQLFYCKSRGIALEDAINMIVSGFCKDVFKELPMEFCRGSPEIARSEFGRFGWLSDSKDELWHCLKLKICTRKSPAPAGAKFSKA